MTDPQPRTWHLPACAIAAIVILEVVAMMTGHNGTMLRLSLVAVAGLGGFSLGRFIRAKQP